MVQWIESNSWVVVPLIAVYIAHLFAKWRDWSSNRKRDRKLSKDIKGILVVELMANLDFLSSIYRIHKKNKSIAADDFIPFAPTRSPRFSVIDKLFNEEILMHMDDKERYYFANVHGKLSKFTREYYIWRERIFYNLLNDKESYSQATLFVMNGFNPLIESIMDLWFMLVQEVGDRSVHPVISELKKWIDHMVKEGEFIVVSYNASDAEVKYGENYKKATVMMCWNNDLNNSPTDKTVFCIQNLIPKQGI